VAEFGRIVVSPVVEVPVGDDAASDAGADGEIGEIIHAPARTEAGLPQSSRIGIVIQYGPAAKLLRENLDQRQAVPARQVGSSQNYSQATVQWPAAPDADGCQILLRDVGFFQGLTEMNFHILHNRLRPPRGPGIEANPAFDAGPLIRHSHDDFGAPDVDPSNSHQKTVPPVHLE